MERVSDESTGMWIDNSSIYLGRLDAKILSLTLSAGALKKAITQNISNVSSGNGAPVPVSHDHAEELRAHYTEVAVTLMSRGTEPVLHLGYVATLTEVITANGGIPE